MMMKALRVCSWSPPPLQSRDVHVRAREGVISCCSNSTRNTNIPKLEPFNNRTKLDRFLKDPPLIEKSQTELSDYCSTIEGDDSYSCWAAYFELKELERESPKEEVERLIIESGGVRSLIGCIHGVAAIHKEKNEASVLPKPAVSDDNKRVAASDCPIPDGIPKPIEEVAEEESARMPDSPYTRLLRARGKTPAWFSQIPDHETD